MKYEKLDLVQGTTEWKMERMKRVTASQVPVILKLSPYQKAIQLMEEKFTGIEAEVNEYKQILFQKGHEAEAAAREWIKANMGINMVPAVLVSTINPDLLASLDGFDEKENVIFEAKYMGAKSLAEVGEGIIKEHHLAQIQAQLLVSGAEKCIYFAMDESGEARTIDVYPDEEMFSEILSKVSEFMRDLRILRSKHTELRDFKKQLSEKYKPVRSRKVYELA